MGNFLYSVAVFLAIVVRFILYVPLFAFLPGSQIGFMLFARWMDWWPEPGIVWFDWIVALILPGYAIYQSIFG